MTDSLPRDRRNGAPDHHAALNNLMGRIVGDRYRIIDRLEAGGPGARWRAVDISSGEAVSVAAIAVRDLSPGAKMRLDYEAGLRCRVRSEWLASFLGLACENDLWFFFSRYIEGETLAARLAQGPLTLTETLAVGRCLFSALRDLHQQRVLHRDLRPRNLVLLGPGATRMVLVDYGVPDNIRTDASHRERVETVWYISPEQAGLIDRDVAEPSDLYSAGAILYHCLSGRPPFQGENIGAVLFEHMTAPVPELRSLGLEVPRALDEIIQRLLRKDPSDRYQLAEAVLEDWETLQRALETGEREPNLAIGARDRRGTLAEPAFVARTRELKILDEQVGRAKLGRGGLILCEGPSGTGKSRLLAELAQRAARDGFWVLRGQTTTEAGKRPFRLLEDVVERLLAACRADVRLAETIRHRLGPHLDAVCAALPQLREIFSAAVPHESGPEAFGETRTLRALHEQLEILGEAHRPLLLILDDCQWADELMCKLIARWHNPEDDPLAPVRYVAMVAAFRSEEVGPDHLLRKIPGAPHVRLEPLEPADVRRLAVSMAGALPDEALDVVTRLAEGSPFMASAVLRGLVESGALVATADGWRVEPLAMATQQSSSRAASVLAQRIDLLPEATIALLSVGAILGKEFDLDAAAHLASQHPSQAIEAVDAARKRQLVWARPDGGRFVFVHDKIRAALLERLAPSERRQLHLRAALRLQHEAPERVSDLAYHFDAAGARCNALRYALEAAEKSRAQHALEVAEQQYRIALRSASAADAATQFRIAEGLGDVVMLRGRYDDAAELFQQAAQLAQDTFAKASIREKIAELAFKRGDKETATREFEATLRCLGRFVPRSLPVFAVLLVWETFVQIMHTVFGPWLTPLRRSEPSPEVRLQLRLFSRLTHGYWFTRGKTQTLWAHLRGMNLGERYRPTLELANAYSEHAPVISLIPMFRRACAYSLRSLKIREQFGDLWGQGQSLTFYGCVLYYSSRYQECIETCREAIRLLERMGDYWLVHIARYQLAASLYHLGDLRGAIEAARANHKSGLELGDEQASGINLDVWARAAGGEISTKILQAELQRERQDPQGTSQVLLAEGVRCIGAGEFEAAVKTLQNAIDVAKRAGVNNAYTLPAQTWLVTALRRQAEATDPYQHQHRKELLRRAERTVRRAIRAARICRNDLPQAYREYGLICALRGESRKALRMFHKSLAVAEELHARYEYAQTLAALARIEQELGSADAERRAAEAERLLMDTLPGPSLWPDALLPREEPVTLSLADRFEAVVNAGRRIASALTKPAIYDEALSAALRILRGEHCRMLELEPQPADSAPSASMRQPLSEAEMCLVERAVQAGRAVTLTDDSQAESFEQTTLPEGSALAVPIHVRGRVAACLLVTHQQVRGLFGPDEERLADFIATLAGAALENAEGFQQLQALNETLEQRVAERTAAAEARAHELARSNQELERVAQELRHTEEQLRVAIHAAESANRAKTHFLTTMSHEIRTPMNGILGMTELTLKTPLTAQQRNYLELVKKSGDTLLTLLNDILDLSKIEAGRMDLEFIPFDLRDTVEGAVRLLAVNASQKGVDLVCRIAPETPSTILGDPIRMRQILVNLVGNAIKFTEQGEVFVQMQVEPTENGRQLHLTVQDTGIGIPPDKLESIFTSFQQADSSTTRRYGGTGLGLAISSQLAALMGGRMWAESELGQGSTFHVVTPLHTPAATVSEPAPSPLRGLHLLCYSEHATSRRVISEQLESSGATVKVTSFWSEAQRVLEERSPHGPHYDAVVVDLAESSSEAVALLEALRSEHPPCGVPFVLLLPAAKSNLLPDNLGPRAEWILTRPAAHAELIKTILKVTTLGGEESADKPATPTPQEHTGLHILLAEDGPVNQEFAAGLLEMFGHTFEIANNGHEAVEAFLHGNFDLVLMDLEMPGMDGLEATRRIRAYESETGEHTPIVAMTAHAVEGFRESCLASGMDSYITKPINLNELLRVLATVVKKQPSPVAATS